MKDKMSKKRPISSAQDPEGYERPAVEDHVRNIITELCKIRDVRNEFNLGDGIEFKNHANSLGCTAARELDHPR